MPLNVRPFRTEHVSKPSILEGFVFPAAFTDGSPLDIEIGCGVGWHPIKYAKANPDRRLIAIEHTREKFEKFEGRFEKNERPGNLLPVHANAVHWITHALAAESVSRYFLLYPNPEPNAANKRWLRAPFFHRLLWTLKPGGTVTLATNVESYMTEAIEYAREFWKLDVVESRAFTRADALSSAGVEIPRTHFEKKYLLRGETCYDAVFEKRKSE